jgi:hypothetical protein
MEARGSPERRYASSSLRRKKQRADGGRRKASGEAAAPRLRALPLGESSGALRDAAKDLLSRRG